MIWRALLAASKQTNMQEARTLPTLRRNGLSSGKLT
jgi:hypothetical protein